MSDLDAKRSLFIAVNSCRDLSNAAKSVFNMLLIGHHNSKTGQCNPGIPTLAKETCLGRSTIFQALRDLKSVGAIHYDVVGGGGRTTNAYSFPPLSQPSRNWTPAPVQKLDPTRPETGLEPSRIRTKAVQDLDPNKEGNREKNKEMNKRERRTRLAPDWRPTEGDRNYARAKGLSEEAIDREIEKIINWSANNPGKLDWSAAWKNWIIREVERADRPRGRTVAEMARMDPYLAPAGGPIVESRPMRGTASALAGVDSFFSHKREE